MKGLEHHTSPGRVDFSARGSKLCETIFGALMSAQKPDVDDAERLLSENEIDPIECYPEEIIFTHQHVALLRRCLGIYADENRHEGRRARKSAELAIDLALHISETVQEAGSLAGSLYDQRGNPLQ